MSHVRDEKGIMKEEENHESVTRFTGIKEKSKRNIFVCAICAATLAIAIGAIDAVFGRVLLFITDFRSAHVVVLLPFLPLAGLGIVWLYRHFQ